MANQNSPFGLTPVRVPPSNKGMGSYTLPDDSTTKLAVGDVVRSSGNGRALSRVTASTQSSLGVVAGIQYKNAKGFTEHTRYYDGAGGTDIVVMVYDDPEQLYYAQIESCSEAQVNQFANFAADAEPDAFRKTSTRRIATPASGATQVRILGLADTIRGSRNINEYGNHAVVECQIVRHERNSSALATSV